MLAGYAWYMNVPPSLPPSLHTSTLKADADAFALGLDIVPWHCRRKEAEKQAVVDKKAKMKEMAALLGGEVSWHCVVRRIACAGSRGTPRTTFC